MSRAAIEDAWSTVGAIAGGDLEGRPVPGGPAGLAMMLAVDRRGLRHLLIPALSASQLPRPSETRGLKVKLDDLQVGDLPTQRYYDVACQEESATANFTAVAAEIVDVLRSETGDVARSIEAVLRRWRWFWDTPPEALSAEQVVGLFGELWFLEFWLDPIDAAVLRAWSGPTRDRHDFKWPAASIEIKATRVRGDGSAAHRITALDQLEDPDQGQLYLFSLRATPDPIAHHSLNRSIDRIRDRLADRPELVQAFDERLGLVGYSPAHREHYETPLRVTAEELYRVGPGFPRLTKDAFPAGVPTGIDAIAYTLDLVACAPWMVSSAPGEESRALRGTLDV